MSTRLHRAIFAGVLAAAAAAVLHLIGTGAWLSVGAAGALALAIIAVPIFGVRALSHLLYLRRAANWRPVEGKHYAFGGLSLAIEDDGRHLWVAADDLQRALHTCDQDEVIAARHAGRWRRGPRARLQLRVDAVVAVLASAPGRMDPHTVRLRRYFEREVLFPAEQRHARTRP